MYSPRTKLDTPNNFDFPHNPYDIQQELMEQLYGVLENKGIGIFESPTGTGKSLTLTCAALRWLEDHESLVRQDLEQRIAQADADIQELDRNNKQADDWITAQFVAKQQREDLHELRRLSLLLQAHEKRLQEMRERQRDERRNKQLHKRLLQPDVDGQNEENHDETEWEELNSVTSNENSADLEKEDEDKVYRDVKIFFCSRTHAQLAQVVREVKRTNYGKRIRCVSLASRQQLCIHPQVRRLPSVPLINERCLDMTRTDNRNCAKTTACDIDGCAQKKRKLQDNVSKSCPFKVPQAMQHLAEAALLDVLDIEELVADGESARACPYYATRAAAKSAQLVMLPYQMLLHRRVRLQSGIDLRGAVIIIDEAHNLLDTIAQLHSSELTLQQLLMLQQQVTAYKLHYAKRFSTANLLCINQLIFVVKRLTKLLQPANGKSSSRMLKSYELTAEGEFFNIDLYLLLQFCERTRFARKLQGFAQSQNREPYPSENKPPTITTATSAAVSMLRKLQEAHQQPDPKQKETQPDVDKSNDKIQPPLATPIRPLLAFLESLTEKDEDGRVLISIDTAGDSSRCSLKYILLNPGGHFEDIVREARAIIVAGGTMQPTTELTEQLFRTCPERVQLRIYDHVVPPDAVMPFVVSKGPTGRQLCFNYTHRSNEQMLTELGMLLQNVCSVVPAGIVCFFPSYEYLDTVYSYLQRTGVLARIAIKKQIFREPRSAASGQSVEQLLAEYAAAIVAPEKQGALLLSVVGGKLSEGLNFADDLGRGVIVVGLPYPSRQSAELQERIRYLEETLGVGSGNEYYENICMKAVNQCIGRSVRHIRDYACVLLLDERYMTDRIQKKLPQWIARNLQTPATFGAMQAATAKFFKGKRHV